MIVNPAPGALVRDPVTKLALEDGAEVDHNDPYFARLLVDGDLVVPAPEAAKDPQADALPAETGQGSSAHSSHGEDN